MQELGDTIVALATPPGVGALGIVRLSGPDSIAVADEIFFGAKLENCASHTIHFGEIRGAQGEVIDEVLTFLFRGPKSYTGEDVVEISGHGSTYTLQRIIERCLAAGARLARPGEFTQRAFLHGKMDLSQAEAVADLIASDSEASHRLAMTQMRGGVAMKIKDLRGQLIEFASLIELELDFGEEDVAFADRGKLKDLVQEMLAEVDRLIDSFRLGNAIKHGIGTVIAGRPNAGKSTLLNRLLDEDRALVSAIAGTTRDTVEEILNIEGVQFRLIDTAGIREAEDQIEAMGVDRTRQKITEAAIVLYVFDVTAVTAEEVASDLADLVQPDRQILAVANKMDLNPYVKAQDFASAILSRDHFVPVSAKNNMNVAYVKERLYDLAVGDTLQTGSTVLTSARHQEALNRTADSLRKVLKGLAGEVTGDFIAMDIRQSLHYLGEITGEISTDDLLDNIFRNFCIGK